MRVVTPFSNLYKLVCRLLDGVFYFAERRIESMRARQKNDNDKAFLLTYQQAAERYNLGVSTIMKTARECGAIRHLGKSARVVTSVMDEYLMALVED
jgi:hypothetical protein